MNKLTSITVSALLIATANLHAQPAALNFDFAEQAHGFTAIFADYPPADAAIYSLTNDWRARPANLGAAPALFISGKNRSDDLFMAWKRQIGGLQPDTDYLLTFEVEFASKYATGLVGVGGAPGDAVALKAGAVPFEPLAVPQSNYLRMNLDKGNQVNGGPNMPTIGTIAKPADNNYNYVLLTRANHGSPMSARTAANGTLWLIFGTDSGFEGETALYFTRLKVWLSPAAVPALWMEGTAPGTARLIWNSGTLQTTTTLAPADWTDLANSARPRTVTLGAVPRRFWRVRQP